MATVKEVIESGATTLAELRKEYKDYLKWALEKGYTLIPNFAQWFAASGWGDD